ncbi:MAG: zf-HC2 domain-containing protein [Spirochaetes bacterium]|nr:zf-HC2 domain-containing protein [Spirochaetota bacterium]
MCPDKQLVSIFMDGELPSPWKEKMESHLSGCPACRGYLEGYRQLTVPIKEAAAGEAKVIESAKERVWQKMSFSLLSGRREASRQPSLIRPSFGEIWRRKLSIPLPAAAAALVIVVMAAFLPGEGIRTVFAGGQGAQAAVSPLAAVEVYEPPTANIILASEEALPNITPVTNLSDVIQYMGIFNSGDMLVLQLPENRSFASSGEPVIVSAAGYRRR